MSCFPLPYVVTQPTPCPNYPCLTKQTATDPGTLTCVNQTFVFARHYIARNGTILPGAFDKTTSTYGGAYVPAVTACRLQITTVPIAQSTHNPNAQYYGF